MRTLWFVLGGFVLLALCLASARLLASNLAEPMRAAVIAFCVIWFVVAGGNLWLGVAKAGYTLAEELPIFLLIFGLPAAVAIFVKWKWL